MERRIGRPGQANYFFALLPDLTAAASADNMARALRHWLGLTGRPRGLDKYHVTLWGWSADGEPGAQGTGLMHRAAERVCQRSFRLSFNEVASFAQAAERPALVMTGGDSVVGADRLHASLDREMRSGGFCGKRSSCHPHLTLLYDRSRATAFRVRPLSWQVTDFVLIRSVPREPYEILGRWALAGP
jgi:2'-5' RNA ligase